MLTSWVLAWLLGVRHASEPDHLVAVSTLVADVRDARRAAVLGVFWGLGHTLALLLLGGALFLLRLRLSARLADVFELCVASMLLVLGARSVARAMRVGSAGRRVLHAHAGLRHVHAGPHDHVHVASLTLARKPLLVGLLHGVAGSGALTTLVLASMPSVAAGLLYIACFGAGSIVGMALLSGIMGLPLGRFARGARVRAGLLGLAGLASLTLGVLWGWPLLWRIGGG